MLEATSHPLHLAAICLVTLAALQLSTGTHRKSDAVIPTELTPTELIPAGSSCLRVRKDVPVSFPGCEPTTAKAFVCEGQCESFDINSRTIQVTECSVCSAMAHRLKKRRVELTCNGTPKNTTIFYPYITECACMKAALWTLTGTDPPIPMLNTTVTPPPSPSTGTDPPIPMLNTTVAPPPSPSTGTPIPLPNTTATPPANSSVTPCKRMFRRIALESEGCKSVTKVPVCSGFCSSFSILHIGHPYISSECSCCAATLFRVKKRLLKFSCNGTTKVRKVFIPIIEKCGCSHGWCY